MIYKKNIRNGNEKKFIYCEKLVRVCMKKTQDTENLRDCPKVCVKNADFHVNATAGFWNDLNQGSRPKYLKAK